VGFTMAPADFWRDLIGEPRSQPAPTAALQRSPQPFVRFWESNRENMHINY
jgi:hypothetical protein